MEHSRQCIAHTQMQVKHRRNRYHCRIQHSLSRRTSGESECNHVLGGNTARHVKAVHKGRGGDAVCLCDSNCGCVGSTAKRGGEILGEHFLCRAAAGAVLWHIGNSALCLHHNVKHGAYEGGFLD